MVKRNGKQNARRSKHQPRTLRVGEAFFSSFRPIKSSPTVRSDANGRRKYNKLRPMKCNGNEIVLFYIPVQGLPTSGLIYGGDVKLRLPTYVLGGSDLLLGVGSIPALPLKSA